MPASTDERTPLLQFPGLLPAQQVPFQSEAEILPNAYTQFCYLVGNRPMEHPPTKSYTPPKDSLYHRATEHRKAQSRMYAFTSALTNTLLLSQIVLGASLTGMGATDSPRWLITVFGALNTIIAGLVAFLKSRGQPMRARMFRDDLDRVVDEIENSATMWRGISQGIHGYDAIDTDEAVTVRSEVARLTRLYDRAVKTNTINDPDYYGGAGVSSDSLNAGLRSSRSVQPQPHYPPEPNPPAPAPIPAPVSAPAPVPSAESPPLPDPDESPATRAPAPTPSKPDIPPTAGHNLDSTVKTENPESSTPAPAPAPTSDADVAATQSVSASTGPSADTTAHVVVLDPDASPATAQRPPRAERTKSNKQSSRANGDSAQDNPSVKEFYAKTVD
ncbi:hypothetical protein CERZMDRAFT_87680 [Cercospora zeae-maydis SCOH1-5]|uniref:SMODS and SLOG-associating 2TM effector domain-containing protein n=1 Tax=Cercospora zeae-maydis SCOH1-5 TaxID=717836 RepID=A0A6A6F4B8_9PEZI|nr:hypothetical protein CERZMDRAFT_87680 [Cercospora zeae-maydis SCOH1-5]